MLKKRILTALVIIPLLVAAVWFDTPLPWFIILAAIWGTLAVYEFYKLVAASKTPPLTYFGIIWTLLFILSGDSTLSSDLGLSLNPDLLTPLLVTSAVVLPLIWLVRRKQPDSTFTAWAWTIAGIFYIGWLLRYPVALRELDNGRNWIFLALFGTYACDTAAFFVGSTIGKHKLAPNISPGKTREGAIGGVFGSIIASLFFVLPTPFALPISWVQAIFLGLLVSISGQLGDLVESLFKRNMGVKDSGRMMPGHGGFLDRIDSVLFAGIVVYYYVIWVIR